MLRKTFAAQKDTREVWQLLQIRCLLRRQGQQLEKLPQRESSLIQRLHRIKGSQPGPARNKPLKSPPARLALHQTAPLPPLPLTGVVPTVIGQQNGPQPPADGDLNRHFLFGHTQGQIIEPHPTTPYHPFLVTADTGRRIALPDEGELILGRFDPSIGLSPDIDLSFEDRGTLAVSRRHARITAFRGSHFIEDLGSIGGTWINQQQLQLGHRVRLTPGDHFLIGNCRLSYTFIPEQFLNLPSEPGVHAFLLVLATDHRFDLPAAGECVIGHADAEIGFTPDVDLSSEGEVSSRVSRRHAKISWHEGQHYVEDLGSVSGTRVKGQRIELGDAVPLRPGDNLWLGGCVLVYDVRREP